MTTLRPRAAPTGMSQIVPVKVRCAPCEPATASSHPESVHPTRLSADFCCTVLASGASKRLKGVVDALQGRARLWLACPEGLFPARDGPAVLDKITDELLVVASDVATSAAASADESVSGKARLRMLAWLVADARGAAEFRQALVGVRPPPIRAVLAARPGSVAAGSFSRLGAGGAETE